MDPRRDALPEPDAPSLELSARLAARIAAEIDANAGWISFDRFMHRALYEPGLGYYSGQREVFGARGDFVTAPELTPLFGACLSRQLGSWLSDPALHAEGPPTVTEFGAGTGSLAAQLINALDRQGFAELRYRIVEPSASLRERQRTNLMSHLPSAISRVEWVDALPGRITGVVVGNEVLDAMPVRCVEWDGYRWNERGVALAEPGDDGAVVFRWEPRQADASLLESIDKAGVRPDPEGDERWSIPYRNEVSPQVQAWVRTVGERIACGALLLIDYGFPAREFYHPQRGGGTLMAHYRHRAHEDVLRWPGLQDITAHVDFSSVLRAGESVGLSALGYASQARFLVNAGLVGELESLPRDRERFWFSQAQAVQKLLSEAEMGELFKVIAFARGLGPYASMPGFAEGDRLHSLRCEAPGDQ